MCVCVQGILDAWLGLWQWVFQPAIGVLMLGAVRASVSVCDFILIILNDCIVSSVDCIWLYWLAQEENVTKTLV